MPTLFTRTQVGPIPLKHRVVMAPLTRSRAEMPGGIPSNLALEYYRQRASDGGLIIAEASAISQSAQGWYGAPGLYDDAQVAGWRRITDAVHAKGGRMFAQLWHTGRAAHSSVNGGVQPVTASVTQSYWQNPNIQVSTASGWQHPSPHRALRAAEISLIVEDYRVAAQYAKKAGFDGVELHGANGYLPDQFLQSGSNSRNDAYGGSIDNRIRFFLEIVEAMASVFGGDRVAARIGPNGTWNDMCDNDPSSLFISLVKRLNAFGLAYLHIIEPRVKGSEDLSKGLPPVATRELRKIFKGTIVSAGGYEPETAAEAVSEGETDLVAFGRYFISNPDLPDRIRNDWPLSAYDRPTFFTFGDVGYTDYPAYRQS